MLSLSLKITDTATPALHAARDLLEDKTRLHEAIAGSVSSLVRDHIRQQSQSSAYHKTAARLGAKPTGYYEASARGLQAEGKADAAEVTITQNADIFKRTTRPVEVVAARKWLTLPASAESYGKRAGEVQGLSFRASGKGQGPAFRAMLVRAPKYTKKADGKRRTKAEATAYKAELKSQTKVLYWLRRSVILPQDRNLLPTDEAITRAAEKGAQGLVQETLA